LNKMKRFCGFATMLAVGAGVVTGGSENKPKYKSTRKPSYRTEVLESFLRPGLNLQIQKVEVNAPNVFVTFRISDSKDLGLDRLGVDTPGAVNIGFTLARIKPGDQQYTSYYAAPPTGITQPRDFTDRGGTYQSLGDGVYRYTMALRLPANFEANSAHTLGVWASRNLEDYDMGVPNSNAVIDFVPSGAPIKQVRDIVRTEVCNQCHDPLAAHGQPPFEFDRREVRICVLCHYTGQINPETGNTVDEKVFIHKLHMGANLPSVTGKPLSIYGTSGSNVPPPASGATPSPLPAGYDPAKVPGKPYQIVVTSENETFDASTLVFPQDVRNCTTCHQKTTQADNWKANPSRAACGSCHDDVNFATGKNHDGIVQTDDSKCGSCHPPDTGSEFDLSVAGVHTILTRSKNLKGLNVKILDMTGASPGSHPTVSFTVTDNAGNPIDISALDRLAFQVAGPTTDYSFSWPAGQLEDARKATAGLTGYTYTFQNALPSDASGTFAVGAEAYRTVAFAGPIVGQTFSVREAAFNPVFYFSVDGSPLAPRRQVVTQDNCNVCHKSLALHGGIRQNTAYCVLCHNTKGTDEERRPADQGPAETINFRTMVHRIHMGVTLDNTFTVFGFSGTPINFNGVRYPADPRNCSKCHVGTTYTVPLPDGLAPTDAPAFFTTPLQPTASACLGCHNAEHAASHAVANTTPLGESCAVCHQEGADFAATKVHSRNSVWPPEDAR
jgi:OmcA/MtrC family decaheme c-type cytochrome